MKAKRTAKATPAATPELNPLVRTAIYRTWNEIAGDAYELGVKSNRDAMELVLDAGRIQSFNRDASTETKQAIDEFMKLDWKAMMKLAKTVKLV